MSIQSTIEASSASLSPSARRVADAIRANPSIVINHNINELAQASNTSVATVVRFCRTIGLTGYAQLRMQLATELGKEAAQFGPSMAFGADIGRDDALPEVMAKISSLEKLAIDETIAGLDPEQVERVARLLDAAPKILLFGIGASLFVAEDLQHKLLRIGRNAFCSRDPHEAWAAASLATPDTVVIGFSFQGETQETLRFIELAVEHGATAVAITSSGSSSLAKTSNEVLLAAARETTLRAGAMVSRIAQLCVVDVLFLAVARLRYDDTVRALWLTRQATRELKAPRITDS